MVNSDLKVLADSMDMILAEYGLKMDAGKRGGNPWFSIFKSAFGYIKWTDDMEVKYDILMDAICKKVLSRKDAFFGNYVENGNGRSLKTYLSVVIIRAVYDISIERYNEHVCSLDLAGETDDSDDLQYMLSDGISGDDVESSVAFRDLLDKFVGYLRNQGLEDEVLCLSFRLNGYSKNEMIKCGLVPDVKKSLDNLKSKLMDFASCDSGLKRSIVDYKKSLSSDGWSYNSRNVGGKIGYRLERVKNSKTVNSQVVSDMDLVFLRDRDLSEDIFGIL